MQQVWCHPCSAGVAHHHVCAGVAHHYGLPLCLLQKYWFPAHTAQPHGNPGLLQLAWVCKLKTMIVQQAQKNLDDDCSTSNFFLSNVLDSFTQISEFAQFPFKYSKLPYWGKELFEGKKDMPCYIWYNHTWIQGFNESSK